MPSPAERDSSVWIDSSKRNIALLCPRAAAAETNNEASVDLPTPAAPTMSVLVPASIPPPRSASRAARPLASRSFRARLPVFGGDKPREDLQTAFQDEEVVIPARGRPVPGI